MPYEEKSTLKRLYPNIYMRVTDTSEHIYVSKMNKGITFDIKDYTQVLRYRPTSLFVLLAIFATSVCVTSEEIMKEVSCMMTLLHKNTKQ